MPPDNQPLLFVQMKTGPVDKVVIGRSAARVLVMLGALVTLAMLSGASGPELREFARVLSALLRP
jgi:hypothetical protein